MFPVSASGVVEAGDLVDQDPRVFVARLAEGIERQRPSKLEVTADGIYFEAELLRLVLNTNLLLPIRSGRVWVTAANGGVWVMYRLSFVQMAIVGTVLSFVFAGLSPGDGSVRIGLRFCGAWLLLVGTNYLIGVARFRSYLLETGRASESLFGRLALVARDSRNLIARVDNIGSGWQMMLRQVLAAGVLFGLGIVLVGWPTKIQRWALRSQASTRGPASRNPFVSRVEKPSYRIAIRVMGVFLIGGGVLVAFAVFRHQH